MVNGYRALIEIRIQETYGTIKQQANRPAYTPRRSEFWNEDSVRCFASE